MAAASLLLSVEELRVGYPGAPGGRPAVDGVAFSLDRGETLGLVGESGCGKSTTALALLGLVPPPGRILGGRIVFDGQDLLALGEPEMRRIRGRRIGLVFQEPASALTPVLTVGAQIAEAVRAHAPIPPRQAWDRAVALLDEMAVPDPAARAHAYPHQLSGGLKQRAMIAIALASEPDLLVADEPTSALDVTVQAEVLDLLGTLQARRSLAVLLVSHDLGVVAQRTSRVAVMYAGRIVEEGTVRDVFRAPLHPYTRGLLNSIPGATTGPRLPSIPGAVPRAGERFAGCAFAPRCAERLPRCDRDAPVLCALEEGRRSVRCHLVESVA